jgi:hypothetical protein
MSKALGCGGWICSRQRPTGRRQAVCARDSAPPSADYDFQVGHTQESVFVLRKEPALESDYFPWQTTQRCSWRDGTLRSLQHSPWLTSLAKECDRLCPPLERCVKTLLVPARGGSLRDSMAAGFPQHAKYLPY